MPENRLPRKLLYGELIHGNRNQGGQKKRFRDRLHSILKLCNIDPTSLESLASDRAVWRKPAVMPLKHLRLTGIKSGRNGARSVTNDKHRPLDPPVAAFPVLHVVDVVPQPSAFEVTRGSTAINSHPTQLNVSWRVRIVVVVFDGLPKDSATA